MPSAGDRMVTQQVSAPPCGAASTSAASDRSSALRAWTMRASAASSAAAAVVLSWCASSSRVTLATPRSTSADARSYWLVA